MSASSIQLDFGPSVKHSVVVQCEHVTWLQPVVDLQEKKVLSVKNDKTNQKGHVHGMYTHHCCYNNIAIYEHSIEGSYMAVPVIIECLSQTSVSLIIGHNIFLCVRKCVVVYIKTPGAIKKTWVSLNCLCFGFVATPPGSCIYKACGCCVLLSGSLFSR